MSTPNQQSVQGAPEPGTGDAEGFAPSGRPAPSNQHSDLIVTIRDALSEFWGVHEATDSTKGGDALIALKQLEEQLEAQREVVKTFLDKFVDEHGYWVGLDDAETRAALVPLRGCFFPVRMASASNPASSRVGVEHPQDSRSNRLDSYPCECLDGGHDTGSGICMCGGKISSPASEPGKKLDQRPPRRAHWQVVPSPAQNQESKRP